jgi:hypothetical protein
MSETTFSGLFQPPAMGAGHAPVPIAGPGTCQITDEGLRFSAFEAKSQALMVAVFLLLLLAIGVAGVAAKAEFGLGSRRGIVIAGACLAGWFFYNVMRGRGQHHQNRPKQIAVPWQNTEVLEHGADGTVVFLMKGTKRKGTIHFKPEAGVTAFMDAIREGS